MVSRSVVQARGKALCFAGFDAPKATDQMAITPSVTQRY